MAVTLDISPAAVTVRPVRYGGQLNPVLGGPVQSIDRLGDRFALDIQLPPMRVEADGRRLIAKLLRGLRDDVLVPFPQVEFNAGAPGAPKVAGTIAGGTALTVDGLTPRYAVKEGQFLSIIHGSRRYVHMVEAQVIADASGLATLTIWPMLRTALADNDVIHMTEPMLLGFIEDADWSYALELTRTVGLAFSVCERE